MAGTTTLTISFHGAFAFWFCDDVVVYAPVYDGHSGFLETDFSLTAMDPGGLCGVDSAAEAPGGADGLPQSGGHSDGGFVEV